MKSKAALKETRYPGVWRRTEGGYLVRGRAKDPQTGNLKEVRWILPNDEHPDVVEVTAAHRILEAALAEIRQGAVQKRVMQRFSSYAASLFKLKVGSDIRSAASAKLWEVILKKHLIPRFGDYYLDKLRKPDVLAWRAELVEAVKVKTILPSTANKWLSVLKVIVRSAVEEYELSHDPMLGVKPLDTSTHRTYTREQPNSLTPEELQKYLADWRERYPDHYALILMGFVYGLRPSSLRPLRRQGESPDVLWDEGLILIRRSHSIGETIMDRTKTGKDLYLPLHPALAATLRWHIETQLRTKAQQESDLLFPNREGELLSVHALVKRCRSACRRLKLKKRLTPGRVMRRTFYNLCDAAAVEDRLARSIAGHSSAQMAERYRTPAMLEGRQRDAVAKLLEMAAVRQPSGDSGGDLAVLEVEKVEVTVENPVPVANP